MFKESVFMLKKRSSQVLLLFFLFFYLPKYAFSMHIMEGFLPPMWAGIWGIVCLPFLFLGFKKIQAKVEENPKLKILLAMAGAFAFVLSALKLPSVTGSCSHPTGVGLGAILFGPTVMSVLGIIVLIFQALLLAHGGITTLGANTFSMGIFGPIVSYFLYKSLQKAKVSRSVSVFLAAALGDLATYIITSLQLAFPSPDGGLFLSFEKFLGIFAITQVPLAISEGLLTVIIFNILWKYNEDTLKDLGV